MTKPPPNVLDLPMEERALMALRAAVEKLIVAHARSGTPLYIWRDGKVISMPADEVRAEAARLQAE